MVSDWLGGLYENVEERVFGEKPRRKRNRDPDTGARVLVGKDFDRWAKDQEERETWERSNAYTDRVFRKGMM